MSASISVSPAEVAFGDTVNVEWDLPDHAKGFPVVYVQAFQNGELVFSAGGYPPVDSVVLGPSQQWQGGAAQGVAKVGTYDMKSGHEKILATVDFPIGA